MMKKIMCSIVALIASAGMLFAFGFGKKSQKKVKIGFLAPTLQTEFFISIDDGLKAGTKARGWDYVSVSFDNDSSKAVTAIENMVTGQCSVIIAMVSDSSCDAALKVAQNEGVKIMECGVQTSVYDVCLNTDQHNIGVQIGTMASDWINSKLSGKANVVVYTTYQNQDMQRRGEGIQEAIKKNSPNAKILEVVDIGKDVVGAGTSTTENMLQKYPGLNVIACYGDAAAVESMEAVKAAGADANNFGIFSCDGTERALKGIASGSVQRGTVQFAPVAPQMLEYCGRVLKGEKFPQVVTMGTNNVTAANISKYYNAE
jgi:ABC-type sugar transport system substrate-binding protein